MTKRKRKTVLHFARKKNYWRISTEPSACAMNTIGRCLVKKPFSTTPTIALISSSIISGFTGAFQRQSRIQLPLSVMTGPHFFTPSRKTHSAPNAASAFLTLCIASPMISTGSAKPVPSLFTLLLGYGTIPLVEKKTAAEKLLAVTEKYKGITSEAYARESSLIESMLEDFGNATLADSIKALDGVADLLAALRTAQDDFNSANDSATAALTAKGESAYALKKPLLAAINEKLVPYVTAMSAIQPEYADFAAKADVEISTANAFCFFYGVRMT